MSLAKKILEKYPKKNEQSDSVIAELKRMDFKSTEDRAKAAQLIKGLLLSSDAEAIAFTKELEDLIDDMSAGPDAEDDSDDSDDSDDAQEEPEVEEKK